MESILKKIEVIESFKLSHERLYIIAILNCGINGLPQNVILEDIETKKQWRVDKRISYLSSEPKLKGEEEVIFVRANIRPVEKYFEQLEKMREDEYKGIFEYKLNPLEHIEKPVKGSILIII